MHKKWEIRLLTDWWVEKMGYGNDMEKMGGKASLNSFSYSSEFWKHVDVLHPPTTHACTHPQT